MLIHRQIIEETEYSMQYDVEFMLSEYRLVKDSLFRTFSVIVAIGDNFLGLNYKLTYSTYNAKENNKSHVGIMTRDIL